MNNFTSLHNTLFHSAYYDEFHIFLKNLFDYSSLINLKNETGETLLHHVCFYGMIDKYYALINMGADLEKTNEGNNLLHYASLSGKDNFLIVELVKMNIFPSEANIKGQTSIHFASNKQIANYFYLWSNRNKINILNLKDAEGNHVIHTAQKLGHFEVVEYWSSIYPEFSSLTNNHGQTWKDIEVIPCLKTKLI